jgi:adenine deaminase
MHSLRVATPIAPATFKIAVSTPTAKVRVMELISPTITAERFVELTALNGFVATSFYDDILKVAMFDRHHGSAQVAFGFLKGFGARLGAVGLTTNLDENTLMIVGSDDGDMALCANALLEAGGGMAIADRGVIIEKLEFPCGGIFSLRPWQEVGRDLRRIQTRLKEMGSPFDKPIFSLSFLPFVTLPALRITARGLVRAKERKIVSLLVD